MSGDRIGVCFGLVLVMPGNGVANTCTASSNRQGDDTHNHPVTYGHGREINTSRESTGCSQTDGGDTGHNGNFDVGLRVGNLLLDEILHIL